MQTTLLTRTPWCCWGSSLRSSSRASSSQMGAGFDGSPAVKAGPVLTGIELLGLGLQGAVGGGVGVDAGKSVAWTVTSPDEHATAVVMCDGSR